MRHKITEGHESNSAEQGKKSLLFFSVNKGGKTDHTDHHGSSPWMRRGVVRERVTAKNFP